MAAGEKREKDPKEKTPEPNSLELKALPSWHFGKQEKGHLF
jgi:hypothetical protein